MKKALVTGAAGFIGSNVVRELLEEGVEVRALIRPGENMKNLEGVDFGARGRQRTGRQKGNDRGKIRPALRAGPGRRSTR